MITKQTHIDLHLPQSWNQCTTAELEAIAAAIINEQQRVGRYHIFDWSRVKLDIVLSINEITVSERVESEKGRVKSEKGRVKSEKFDTATENSDAEWLVQRPEDKEPWTIQTGQLVALTERLAWIDDEKADKTVFMFPYPELTLVQGSGFKVQVSGSKFQVSKRKAYGQKPLTINREPLTVAGPPPLLDGYTWREYRILTDWMQEYMRLSNAKRDASTAQREFLAVLFKKKDDNKDNKDNREPLTINPESFAGFSPVKWQVILFWWSSLMGMLAKKFTRVFKPQPVGKHRPQKADTPWDFYNRVTATIQKYIGGLSSQDVDNQPYGVTLQQLEMMADEAAEMEKLKKR